MALFHRSVAPFMVGVSALILYQPTAFSLFDEPLSGVMPVHVEILAEEMLRLDGDVHDYGYLAS